MDKTQPLGRLTLAKSDGIYVDYYMPLATHQIDGIRFLYRNYKKVKPGVILNDPSGYGKCIQVVSFLNAVHTLLTRPVLVMCEPSAIENWRQHFKKFTDINSSDIAPETATPFENYLVFIKPLKEATAFSRRHWSVVVVHDNIFTRDRFQTNFTAYFKIWVTSVNMKENLSTFASIYEWIHPNSRVNISNFEPKTNNPHEVIEKLILVDAFLDDIVIRRSGLFKLFESKRKMAAQLEEPPLKVSRKNKDPTGKKVKRSKKNNEDNAIKNNGNGDMAANAQEINVNFNNNQVNNAKAFDSNKEFCFLETNDAIKKSKMESIEKQQVKETNKTKELSDADITMEESGNLFSSDAESMNFQNCINDIVENENKANQNRSNENHSQLNVECETRIQNSECEDYVIKEKTDLSKKSYLTFLKTLAEKNKEIQEHEEASFFEKNKPNINSDSKKDCYQEVSTINVTMKNKDPTGMKIKRSRKATDDKAKNANELFEDIDMIGKGNKDTNTNKNYVETIANGLDSNNESCFIDNNHSNKRTDVDSFNENEDAQVDRVKKLCDVDVISQKSENLFLETETELNFQKCIDDIVENENQSNTSGLNENKSHLDATNNEDSTKRDDPTAVNVIESPTKKKFNLSLNKKTAPKELEQNNPVSNIDHTKHVSENNVHQAVSKFNSNEEKKAEQNTVDEKFVKTKKSEDVRAKLEEKSNLDVTKKVKSSSIDDILAKFEQDALKKYKGSFLDRLF